MARTLYIVAKDQQELEKHLFTETATSVTIDGARKEQTVMREVQQAEVQVFRLDITRVG